MTTTEKHTITVPDAGASVADLETFDLPFEEDEQATRPITEEARLWWFNGLPTDAETLAVGWHIRADINPYIDETMAGMGMPRYLVQHKRPDKHGSTDPKPYWRLHTCSLIIIARRVQSALEMNKAVAERYGVAFGWETVHDEQGQVVMKKGNPPRPKKQTVLKLRAFVHELVRHGYREWLPVSLSGFSTDSLLEALAEQHRVLDAYSDYRRGQGKNAVAPYFLFSLPLGPGQMRLVGEPPDQGTIYPIVAKVPQSIDRTYLAQHLAPAELVEQLRSDLLMEAIQWSIDESLKIAGSNGQVTAALPASAQSQEGVSSPPPQALPPDGSSDPYVNQAQLSWIAQNYCQNNDGLATAICKRFGVGALNQLRKSHFTQMVAERQQSR